MNTYTIPDLQKRYKLKKSALHKFLSRHMININQNGQHAIKRKNKWYFDETAVSILDRLRNFGQVPFTDPTPPRLIEIILNMQSEITRLSTRMESIETKLAQLETIPTNTQIQKSTKKCKNKNKKKKSKG